MPIEDGTSITDHERDPERVLKLFTDRDAQCHLFINYLHAEPPVEQMIFFHGDGGNGKSLLLKHLRAKHCRLVSRAAWERLQQEPFTDDRSFLRSFSAIADAHPIPVPCIYHDFAPESSGEDSPRQDWSALMMLRRELGAHRLKLPLFDFAVIHYLHAVRQLSPEQIRRLLPRDEADFTGALVDLATSPEIPFAGLAVKVMALIDNHLGDRFALWKARRGLDGEQVVAIRRMDPRAQLPDALPGIMGKDLCAAMRLPDAPKRLVLLFDTHEAFWGTGRHLESTESYFERDEWLRRLLRELYNPNPGIVVAVAGREPPRWPEADPEDAGIAAEYLDTQPVGHLNRADAKDYLDRALAPITDPATGVPPNPERFDALCNVLIEHAEVDPGHVHPFYLGLAVDVVLSAHRRGVLPDPTEFPKEPDLGAKGRRLVKRLLRNCSAEVKSAVKALAAARSFDRELFYALGERLHFWATRAAFDVLIDFSFVWQDPGQDEGRYRIHDLLRRILGELAAEETLEAHAALEAIYRERAEKEPTELAEAIFHANRQDWLRGANEWAETMEEALKNARYPVCEALVPLQPVLLLETAFARGNVAHLAGELALVLSHHKTAESAFEQAIDAYGEALLCAPDYIEAHNNKGLALQGLGELRTALSDHPGAQAAYTQAINAYDATLQRAPDYVATHSNKGNALRGLGDLRAALNDHAGAQDAYAQAINAYDAALQRAPDSIYVYNGKGNALARLGKLRTALSDHAGAQAACAQAVAAYDAALQHAPDYVAAHSNKGNAFRQLGDLRATLSDHTGADAAYTQAINAYDEALQRAPDLVQAHNNKGNALVRMGELRAALSNHSGAQQAYTQAVMACDAALERAPDYVYAHNNKGNALCGLGELRMTLSDHAGAEAAYTRAVGEFDEAMKRSPDYINALWNKGICLRKFAVLAQEQGDPIKTRERLTQVRALLIRAADLAPNNKGIAEERTRVGESLNMLGTKE